MALVTCTECRRQISDRAPACPHCGCPAAPSADLGDAQGLPRASAEASGEACPFCARELSPRAVVCGSCRAWHGYAAGPGYTPRRRIKVHVIIAAVLVAYLLAFYAVTRVVGTRGDNLAVVGGACGGIFAGIGLFICAVQILFAVIALRAGPSWHRGEPPRI